MAGERGRVGRRERRAARDLLTPAAIGDALRAARARAELDLAEVHDRTGVSWRNLEALESGQVDRFSDPSAAVIAVRRYAEVVDIDPEPLARSLLAMRPDSRDPSGRVAVVGAPAAPPGAGHLSRFSGDQSHLRAFTQTAQVSLMGIRAGFPLETGIVPATGWDGAAPGMGPNPGAPRRARKAPLFLRLCVWVLFVLVLIGAAGLVVDRYRPQWLRQLHLVRDAAPTTTSTTSPTTPGDGKGSSVTTASNLLRTSGGGGADQVAVRSPSFSVEVKTARSAWVSATVGSGLAPVIAQTLEAGQSVQIKSVDGVVNLDIGSVYALITVEIGGRTVPGWQLRPTAIPFTVTFQSTTS